tara:strand:+ start:9679 stop:10083 length:405 start_codon:yes stop_codon:yes gene_type:complete
MFNPKYIAIACIQATENKLELINKFNSLPGDWDIINLDGTLRQVSNKHNNESICDSNVTRLAYIKSFKNSHKDNRTYMQVDSMEVYVKYHILKNPNLYVACASVFSDYEMGFDIKNFVEELGVDSKNIMYKVIL